MRTLYIECNMGAAGDMLMSALCELIPDPDAFIAEMNALNLPEVHFVRGTAQKCGITGTHIAVTVRGHEEIEPHSGHEHHDAHRHHDHDHHGHPTHDHCDAHPVHEHHHACLNDIGELLAAMPVSDWVRENAIQVYRIIAEAESAVHGVAVDQIHFHEVGMLDAVADVVGVCMLMEQLQPDQVIVSPVHVGSGQVRCMHGILPVPAPATARILMGVPIYGGEVHGELCTPTGAALLKHFADRFGDMPVMTVEKIGYGMGKKDFERANCVRAMLGESEGMRETVAEISCNLDDMTAEEIGFAMELLREAGALDVYAIPIQMKKSRPGTLLCCLCMPEERQRFAELMLRHTSTIGVRCQTLERVTLSRNVQTVETRYGGVRVKRAAGLGVEKVKPEFDDLADIARRSGLTLQEIKKAVDAVLKNDKEPSV